MLIVSGLVFAAISLCLYWQNIDKHSWLMVRELKTERVIPIKYVDDWWVEFFKITSILCFYSYFMNHFEFSVI